MVAPTSYYSGLRDSEGLVFHLQTHESPIHDISRRQILRLSFLFALLATRNLMSWNIEPSCSYLTNPRDARSQQGVDSFLGLLGLATSRLELLGLCAPFLREPEV